MNYRHAFHAGNFADLVKHAALIRLLDRLTADPTPLTVVDTHAGAGLYDLTDPMQARSREAEAGVKRFLGGVVPPIFTGMRAAIARRNPNGPVRLYPGSPALIADALRPADVYRACELRPDDFTTLKVMLRKQAFRAEAMQRDGYVVAEETAATTDRLFVLTDPPFERSDDYVRTAAMLEDVFARKPDATALVWLPLKDLETLDGFVRRLEAARLPETVVAETRLRPLRDPMRLNGCVLVAVGPPDGFAAELEAICAFVAETLGDPEGRAKVWTV